MMILYLGPIRQWIRHIWDIDLRLLSSAGCMTSVFFTYFSFQLSSWLLVTVTTERLISVMFPHQVKLNCTTKKSGITVLVIIMCLAAVNAHYFYGYRLQYIPSDSLQRLQCGPRHELVDYSIFLYRYWSWIDFVISFAVPFAIMLIDNILIIVNLKRQTNRRRKMSISHTEKEERSVTVMLIALCIIYFICLLPCEVFFIVLPYLREAAIKMPFANMMKRMDYLLFLHTIVSCLSYINSTTNFILYFLSGTRFRAEVRHLFNCRRHDVGNRGVFG